MDMTVLTIFFLLAVFMLGAILGSFLNVVAVDSMNTYMSNDLENKSELGFVVKQLRSKSFWKHLATHRSSCDTCKTVLTPKELVPVVSYLWQKGTCRSCNTSFAPQHLYVELFAGAIFTGVFLTVFNAYATFSPMFIAELAYMFVFFGLGMIMLLFDYEHMIVPNMLVYPMFVLALGAHVLGFQSVPDISLVESLVAALTLAIPLFALWFFSKGRWMGMADSKIALVMGALLGFAMGISAWVVSFWLGAAIGLLMIALTSKKEKDGSIKMKSAIPFGPFMFIALWGVYCTGYILFTLV